MTPSHVSGASSRYLPIGILERELPPLLEDHDGHRRELLGDRPEAELGLRRVRNLVLGVGQPVALAEEDRAVPGHEDRAVEVVDLDAGVHVLFELRRQFFGPAERGNARARPEMRSGGTALLRGSRRISLPIDRTGRRHLTGSNRLHVRVCGMHPRPAIRPGQQPVRLVVAHDAAGLSGPR